MKLAGIGIATIVLVKITQSYLKNLKKKALHMEYKEEMDEGDWRLPKRLPKHKDQANSNYKKGADGKIKKRKYRR